jgi:Gpi18-like mannosyltransferase
MTTKKKYLNGFIFVFMMWLLSRLLIITAMYAIAPAIIPDAVQNDPKFVAEVGWERFVGWDSYWYRSIATVGYEYADDFKQHSVAFFPLYPLITRGVMSLGIPFAAAATVVNNFAFLGALLVLYNWVKERQTLNAARWATAVLAWCPYSLFGTVTYTEGTFLFLSTAALQAFDQKQHVKAGILGALTTATRITGVPLIPTFLLVAWKERRSALAYGAGIATSLGLLVFMLYCAIRFGEPVAFLRAQRGWQAANGTGWDGWIDLFTQDLILRKGASTAFLAVTKILMFFGGGFVLWRMRSQLPRVAVVYGFCSLAMLFSSGSVVNSVNRYAYGIVSLSFALGVLLSRYPRWGYLTMGIFALLSIYFSIRFSWGLWVA